MKGQCFVFQVTSAMKVVEAELVRLPPKTATTPGGLGNASSSTDGRNIAQKIVEAQAEVALRVKTNKKQCSRLIGRTGLKQT